MPKFGSFVSAISTTTRHRTEAKKTEANQAQCGGFGSGDDRHIIGAEKAGIVARSDGKNIAPGSEHGERQILPSLARDIGLIEEGDPVPFDVILVGRPTVANHPQAYGIGRF